MRLLKHYEVLKEAQDAVHVLLATARQSLDSLPDGESRSSLLSLVDFLARQSDAVGRAD
jgi:geranylgeranyl pyrophosphate synthase